MMLEARMHAHITRTHTLCFRFAYFFAPVPSDSRSTALQVMASTLDRAQLLDYTRAGMWLFEIRDRYLRCTRIKFNCNMRVVHTYSISHKHPYSTFSELRAYFERTTNRAAHAQFGSVCFDSVRYAVRYGTVGWL